MSKSSFVCRFRWRLSFWEGPFRTFTCLEMACFICLRGSNKMKAQFSLFSPLSFPGCGCRCCLGSLNQAGCETWLYRFLHLWWSFLLLSFHWLSSLAQLHHRSFIECWLTEFRRWNFKESRPSSTVDSTHAGKKNLQCK